METLDTIPLSTTCGVTLHRTLRIPDDCGEHPLPPSLGAMTAYAAGPGEYVVPMRRAEALWLEFRAPWWRPHALKVGIGGIDAISGETFADALTGDPQDYVVVPDQPWLDGINAAIASSASSSPSRSARGSPSRASSRAPSRTAA